MPHIKHLLKDKKLAPAVRQAGKIVLKKHRNVFLHLCSSIMSQQLSTKVKVVIWNRFLDLYGGQEPTPQQVLETPDARLRAIGLSNAKVSYVKNVARFSMEKGMDIKKINRMNNEEVIEYLTEIKGVGRWTVEMILMFTLGREDVFAADDFGIQSAMIRIYKLRNADKKKFRRRMISISEQWAPYRTYACMALWRWKDAKLIQK